MVSVLEATAALTITAALLGSTLAAMQQATILSAKIDDLSEALFAARQFESLFDRAASAAGGGPTHPVPMGTITDDTAVFRADLDGDGKVSDSGSETITLEVRVESSAAKLRHRLGKQTMTVLEFDHTTASIEAYNRYGASTQAPTASLLELTVEGSTHAALGPTGDNATLHLLFAIPEALLR